MGIESLNFFSALPIALSGFLTVFIVLVCLSGLIRVISRAVQMLSPDKAKEAPQAAAPVSTPVPAAMPAQQQVELLGVDDLTAACIMAVVSHETGISLSELIFKRIKAL